MFNSIFEEGNVQIKCCPFRSDKKGRMNHCVGGCALYIGNFPSGKCAIRVIAENTSSENENNQNK